MFWNFFLSFRKRKCIYTSLMCTCVPSYKMQFSVWRRSLQLVSWKQELCVRGDCWFCWGPHEVKAFLCSGLLTVSAPALPSAGPATASPPHGLVCPFLSHSLFCPLFPSAWGCPQIAVSHICAVSLRERFFLLGNHLNVHLSKDSRGK